MAFGEQLNYLLESAAEYERKHYRAVGEARVASLSVQDVSLTQGKPSLAVLKVCVDATQNDAVDELGHSVRKKGALAHFIEVVIMTYVAEKGWLVGQEDDTPVKSC